MIKIENLCHRHHGQQSPVLQHLCLEVPSGQTLALLGRSGSGKSTLLNLIAGIEALQSGDLSVAGTNMREQSDDQRSLHRRRQIGFVYQFFNLLPTLTVAENLSLPLELNDFEANQSGALVHHWLERIGLSQMANHYPDTLSGGEQQRVAIARALIHQPGLVLADEPTGNLDSTSGKQALRLLLEGSAQQRQTLVLVTHSRLVAEQCDRIISIHDGAIREGLEQVAW